MTTEEKIKIAAQTVFHKKGFAATRTRDIAEEANINLALLNYYFRSKKRLFEIIMTETLTKFAQNLIVVMDDEASSFDEKVEILASSYIEFLKEEPEIPVFIMSEMRNSPEALQERIPIKKAAQKSTFFRQLQELRGENSNTEINLIHFLLNLMGLIIFPFISRNLFAKFETEDNIDFDEMMEERKKLIPIWIKAMISKD
ncbi:MAG: TetR/AcrR family transcriptional regulator [Bacteroidales bacterium]